MHLYLLQNLPQMRNSCCSLQHCAHARELGAESRLVVSTTEVGYGPLGVKIPNYCAYHDNIIFLERDAEIFILSKTQD